MNYDNFKSKKCISKYCYQFITVRLSIQQDPNTIDIKQICTEVFPSKYDNLCFTLFKIKCHVRKHQMWLTQFRKNKIKLLIIILSRQ